MKDIASGSPIYHSCTQKCFLDILWINAVVFSRSFMDESISVFLSYYWFLHFVFLVLSLMYALVFAWASTDVGSIYHEMVLIWTAFLLRSLFSPLGYDSCISTQRRKSVLNKTMLLATLTIKMTTNMILMTTVMIITMTIDLTERGATLCR